jgi:hypothetical protein
MKGGHRDVLGLQIVAITLKAITTEIFGKAF